MNVARITRERNEKPGLENALFISKRVPFLSATNYSIDEGRCLSITATFYYLSIEREREREREIFV